MGWSEPEPPRGQYPRLFEVRALGNGLCLASGFFSVYVTGEPVSAASKPSSRLPGKREGLLAPSPPPFGHARLPGGAGEDLETPVPARSGLRRKPGPVPKAEVRSVCAGRPGRPSPASRPGSRTDGLGGPLDIAASLGPTPHRSRRWWRAPRRAASAGPGAMRTPAGVWRGAALPVTDAAQCLRRRLDCGPPERRDCLGEPCSPGGSSVTVLGNSKS